MGMKAEQIEKMAGCYVVVRMRTGPTFETVIESLTAEESKAICSLAVKLLEARKPAAEVAARPRRRRAS